MSANAPLPPKGPAFERQSDAHRRTRPALVIDGEAVVVSRVSAGRPSVPKEPTVSPQPQAARHLDAAPRAIFGRRDAARRPRMPDLVFQGMASRPAPAPRTASRRGLDVFTDAAGFRGGPSDRRMAGFAAVVALLALPVLVLSAPIAPAEATPGLPDQMVSSLVIDHLVTSIAPRGAGAVLTVEGRIRNASGRSAAIPPVRIALTEPDGGQRSKVVLPAVSSLPAGQFVRFHSAVAVAKDTRGKIDVAFLAPPAPSGKTLIE